MKCEHCGKELNGSEVFCPGCGYRLKGERENADMDTLILEELVKINKQLEEGNRQRAHLMKAIGQIAVSSAAINFLK
ncbi:MAG: zinc ribbon domain-containing protein [Lachnospiraceae bacterium]|nr:zinc ribbon domain-containing protein [Lachnospiraceae bacterium]